MLITINPEYSGLTEWLHHIPDDFDSYGDIIYNKRNTLRLATSPYGTKMCIKRYHIPHFFNRIAYTIFRKTKAQRAYENALTLLQHKINTPKPVAYIICKKNGLTEYSYLITEHCPYKHNMSEFGECTLAGNESVLKSFAQFTAQLHENNIMHLDYSPGNILFDIKDNTASFSVIDINRMKFTHIDVKNGCKNFCRLWGSSEMMRLIAHHYAIARKFDIQQCERLTLDYWHRFWEKRKYKQHMFSNYD